MNTKRFITGSIVVFIVMMILEYVLHNVIMKSTYEALGSVLRTPEAMMTYFPAMILAYLLMSFGFCYIFIKGYEGKGIGEGIRFGLLVGFAFAVPSSLINYTVFPISGYVMLGHFIGLPIIIMILGAVIAALYKPK